MATHETIRIHKEISRDIIGQPPPTKVRSGRGRKRRHQSPLAGALDIYAPEPVPDDIVVPRFAKNPIAFGGTAHVPVTTKKLREKHDAAPVIHFTKEVIAHANFLMDTKGKAAMELYLTQIKEQGNNMASSVHIAESLHESRESKLHETPGDIGAMVVQAEGKAQHYRELSVKDLAEAEKWGKIAEHLKAALEATNSIAVPGKKPRVVAERAPHGYWREKMAEFFGTENKPRTGKEIRDQIIVIRPVVNPHAAFSKLKNDGIITPHGEGHWVLAPAKQ